MAILAPVAAQELSTQSGLDLDSTVILVRHQASSITQSHCLSLNLLSMAPPTNREEALVRLRQTIDSGKVVLGAGAGIGLSAKFIERGGADLIVLYNSGRFRMAGRGSLAGLMPYGDANAIVLEMVRHCPSLFQPPALSASALMPHSHTGERSHPDRPERGRSGGRVWHGPVPRHVALPATAQGHRLLRRAEFPHCRPHRRHVPPEP